MNLTGKQTCLLEFVKSQHGEQKRKYTGEPYWTHPLEVAKILSYFQKEGIEIALCHDLFEDTNCDSLLLLEELQEIGYSFEESGKITKCVYELTDCFTKDNYPEMNRRERKSRESHRLSLISSLSQTVKYADLIHNTKSIIEHDEGFAKIYIREKEEILKGMTKGESNLHTMCLDSIIKSKELLNL